MTPAGGSDRGGRNGGGGGGGDARQGGSPSGGNLLGLDGSAPPPPINTFRRVALTLSRLWTLTTTQNQQENPDFLQADPKQPQRNATRKVTEAFLGLRFRPPPGFMDEDASPASTEALVQEVSNPQVRTF